MTSPLSLSLDAATGAASATAPTGTPAAFLAWAEALAPAPDAAVPPPTLARVVDVAVDAARAGQLIGLALVASPHAVLREAVLAPVVREAVRARVAAGALPALLDELRAWLRRPPVEAERLVVAAHHAMAWLYTHACARGAVELGEALAAELRAQLAVTPGDRVLAGGLARLAEAAAVIRFAGDDLAAARALAEEAVARGREALAGGEAPVAVRHVAVRALQKLATVLHSQVHRPPFDPAIEDVASDPRAWRARALIDEALAIVDGIACAPGAEADVRAVRRRVLRALAPIARALGEPAAADDDAPGAPEDERGADPADPARASWRASDELRAARAARRRGDEAAFEAHAVAAEVALRIALARDPADTRLGRHLSDVIADHAALLGVHERDRALRRRAQAITLAQRLHAAEPAWAPHGRRLLELLRDQVDQAGAAPPHPACAPWLDALIATAEAHLATPGADVAWTLTRLSEGHQRRARLREERGDLAGALADAHAMVTCERRWAIVDGGGPRATLTAGLWTVATVGLAAGDLPVAIEAADAALAAARARRAAAPDDPNVRLDTASALLVASRVADARGHAAVAAGHRAEALAVLAEGQALN